MFCPYCGKQANDGDKVCTECGKRLPILTEEEPVQQAQETQQTAEEQPQAQRPAPEHDEFFGDNSPNRNKQNPYGNSGYQGYQGQPYGTYQNQQPNYGYQQPYQPPYGGYQQPYGGYQGQPRVFCPYCHAEIPFGASHCPNCRNALGAPQKKKTDGFALTGFILSLVGMFMPTYLWGLILGLVVCAAGLTFSIIGMVRSKKSGAKTGFAIAGIIISAIGLFTCFSMLMLELGLYSYAVPYGITSDFVGFLL